MFYLNYICNLPQLFAVMPQPLQNINVYPALATWKKNAAGECPIHISIDVDGKRAAFPSIKKKVKPAEWDSAAKKVKGIHNNAGIINALIRQKIGEYEAEFTAKQLQDVRITKASVKKQIKGNDSGQDFYKFCGQQIEAVNYKSSTQKNYRGEVTKLKKYVAELSFSDITYSFLQGYERYMRDKLHNKDNTVWKSLKFMNTMIGQAVKIGGIISKNPFKEYSRGKYKQGIPVYLEWGEVQELHKAVVGKPMTNARRLSGYYALLSYYSGLRFGDAITFTYDKKVIEDSNGKRLVLYAQKNGEIVSIQFTKYIAEIVDYIRDKPIDITNQEFNEDIKFIAGLAGITKDISSHSGRHSFAMRCSELGMSIDDVQKLLGHGQRKSTEIYFRIKNKRLDQSMKIWEQ